MMATKGNMMVEGTEASRKTSSRHAEDKWNAGVYGECTGNASARPRASTGVISFAITCRIRVCFVSELEEEAKHREGP